MSSGDNGLKLEGRIASSPILIDVEISRAINLFFVEAEVTDGANQNHVVETVSEPVGSLIPADAIEAPITDRASGDTTPEEKKPGHAASPIDVDDIAEICTPEHAREEKPVVAKPRETMMEQPPNRC